MRYCYSLLDADQNLHPQQRYASNVPDFTFEAGPLPAEDSASNGATKAMQITKWQDMISEKGNSYG